MTVFLSKSGNLCEAGWQRHHFINIVEGLHRKKGEATVRNLHRQEVRQFGFRWYWQVVRFQIYFLIVCGIGDTDASRSLIILIRNKG